MHAGADDGRRDSRGKVAVADQADAGSAARMSAISFSCRGRSSTITTRSSTSRSSRLAMFFRLCGDGRIEIDGVFARRTDDNFVHVAVGRVQQAAALRRRQHSDRSRRARGAQIGAFQRIDRDIDLGNFGAVGKLGANFLADVEHGRFVALALADHDRAAHGDGVHGPAHGLGGHLIAELALALSHGAGRGDGGHLYHAQESRRQVALNILPENCGPCLPDESAYPFTFSRAHLMPPLPPG